MAREVGWAESASDDLAEIASYIEKDSEFYAAAVVCELIEAARSLELFALRGRVVPEYRDSAIRELLVRDYRLVYEVSHAPFQRTRARLADVADGSQSRRSRAAFRRRCGDTASATVQ